jgi:hypothetical protein
MKQATPKYSPAKTYPAVFVPRVKMLLTLTTIMHSLIFQEESRIISLSRKEEGSMQLPLDTQEFIRRAFHLEGKTIRQIERETGHCRQAIRRVISQGQPALSPTPPASFRSAPIFGPFQARVDALLTENEHLPRKQRYTAHRIFEIIQSEGYRGCESRIRQYLAQWKEMHHPPELFLPLAFEPGQDAQVDWGEAIAVLDGQRQKVQFFIMHLCYSRRTFAMCFPSQNQESFL